MKRTLFVTLLCAQQGIFAQDATVHIRDVMTRQQFDLMGLAKLTDEERVNFETWLTQYQKTIAQASGAAAVPRPGDVKAKVTNAPNKGSSDVITVDPNSKRKLSSIGSDGKVMQLNDGRVFSSLNEFESKKWTIGQTIVVTKRNGGYSTYLLNATTGTEVMADEVTTDDGKPKR